MKNSCSSSGRLEFCFKPNLDSGLPFEFDEKEQRVTLSFEVLGKRRLYFEASPQNLFVFFPSSGFRRCGILQ